MISESKLDGIIHLAVFNVMLPGVQAALLIRFPILGFPIFNGLFNIFMKIVGQEFYKESAKVGNFMIIDAMTEQEKVAYDSAKTKALQLRAEGTLGDANAMADIQKACANLIHFDGSN